MARQHLKQLTLRLEFGDYQENLLGYHEGCIVRSVEEGEVLAYTENVGHPPKNLPKSHPAYKLWTWKTRRDGEIPDIVAAYESTL